MLNDLSKNRKLSNKYCLSTFIILILSALSGCGSSSASAPADQNIVTTPTPFEPIVVDDDFIKGVDLSYVNEMESCDAQYYEADQVKDNYQIMADHGANLVRLRLWHTPDWQAQDGTVNQFSTFEDVKKSIKRAQDNGMEVLLDFHYSDNWTDPEKQTIPKVWESIVQDIPALSTALYDYTYQTLIELNNEGLMPEYVQVGNETNREIMLLQGENGHPINWQRNIALFNAGIKAVNDAGIATQTSPKTVVHIADPNNAAWWFGEAANNNISDYDIMGLSFYPEWHPGTITDTGNIISQLKATHNKEVMIVETGLIWSQDWHDDAGNMMGADNFLVEQGYGIASPEAQRDWLIDLSIEVKKRGGIGVIYWEPSWVSTDCSTQWGKGSHWENASFFDFDNHLIANGGVQFLEQNYQQLAFPEASAQ